MVIRSALSTADGVVKISDGMVKSVSGEEISRQVSPMEFQEGEGGFQSTADVSFPAKLSFSAIHGSLTKVPSPAKQSLTINPEGDLAGGKVSGASDGSISDGAVGSDGLRLLSAGSVGTVADGLDNSVFALQKDGTFYAKQGISSGSGTDTGSGDLTMVMATPCPHGGDLTLVGAALSSIERGKTLGAWEKPLFDTVAHASRAPVLRESDAPANVFLSTDWPTLRSDSKKNEHSYNVRQHPSLKEKALPESRKSELGFTHLSPELVHRFPWAAKMNPQSRNLHKKTTPAYLDDGTPKILVPDHVLLHGLENQKEYIIGQFYRCSTPSGGLINAVANKIWGRKCKIFSRKLDESSYLFHIPDASTRLWVLQRGVWHIDDCMLFVAPWSDSGTLEIPQITTILVWVTLKNVPVKLYSLLGISWIGSGLGAPMATNKPRLDPTHMGEAKILVEVELCRPFPKRIVVEDKQGKTFNVDVEYAWIPTTCKRCGELGHKDSHCLLKENTTGGTFSARESTPDILPTVGKDVPMSTTLTTQQWVPVSKKVSTPTTTTMNVTENMILQSPAIDKTQRTNNTSPMNKSITIPIGSTSTSITTNTTMVTTARKNPEAESPTIATSVDPNNSPTVGEKLSPAPLLLAGNVPVDITQPTSNVAPTVTTSVNLQSTEEEASPDNSSNSEKYNEAEDVEEFLLAKSSRGRSVKPSLKAKEIQRTPTRGRRGKGRVRGRSHR